MIDRKFEKYRGGPNVPPENRVHVSLAPTGRIFLSGLAYDLLGRPAAVNLYFSRVDDQIAIEPAPNPQNADAMPILTQARTPDQRRTVLPPLRHPRHRHPALHRPRKDRRRPNPETIRNCHRQSRDEGPKVEE